MSKKPTKSNILNIFTHIVAGEGINHYCSCIFQIVKKTLTFYYYLKNQGDWNHWNQLPFRFVQGAWCLAALVMVNAYCTTLISYLISPRLMPVAKTYEDVASGNPQMLKLLAEKNDLLALYSLVFYPVIYIYTNMN